MSRDHLINYALYQLGWFACVLGAAAHRPWTGCLTALALVVVHLARSRERATELRLVALATGVGAVIEAAHMAAGTYRFTSGMVLDGLPPAWLLTMWAQFATTFRHSLRTIVSRPGRAALFGAIGAPVAYLAGEGLGAVTFLGPSLAGVLRLSFSWALAMVLFSAVVRRMGAASAPRRLY